MKEEDIRILRISLIVKEYEKLQEKYIDAVMKAYSTGSTVRWLDENNKIRKGIIEHRIIEARNGLSFKIVVVSADDKHTIVKDYDIARYLNNHLVVIK